MKRYFLLAVVILGTLLRLLSLSKLPAGLSPDEAAFGYNAYSLLKTGKDEWGQPLWALPFTNLRSFGDYRYPLYAFLTVPSVKFFGLNEFAVRLPNAVLGGLGIIAIFFLGYELFPKKKWTIGLTAAFLMAISPWHISLSRGAFETNAVTTLFPLGLALLLRGKSVLAAIILAICSYSYLAARILVLPVSLLTVSLTQLPRVRWLKFAVLLIVLALPGFWSLLGKGNTRMADVGLFSPTDSWQEVSDRRFAARNAGLPDSIARVFSNKGIYVVSQTAKNYLSYFSPQFLFTSGAGEANYGIIPGRGLLYYFEIPLLLIFLYTVVRYPSRTGFLILALILISPVPAALAKGVGFAANRAASMIPFLAIASAFSFTRLLEYLPMLRRSGKTILAGVALVSLIFFLEDYFFHSWQIFARPFNYGLRETLTRVMPMADRYSDIRFSRALSEPHIYVAFYGKVDPAFYQQEAQKWVDFDQKFRFLDQFDGYYLGKYRFGDIHPRENPDHPILFVGRPEDFPADFPEYFHIDYLTGQTAVVVAEKSP